MATRNRAWVISAPGHLTLVSRPMPTPSDGQVLVRMAATSLNYKDVMVTNHSPKYPSTAKPNLVPCCDGTGTVISTGANSAWRDRVGARVLLHPTTWTAGDVANFRMASILGSGDVDGALQEHVVLDDAYVLRAPTHVGLVEASAYVTAGLAAYNALFEGPIETREGVAVVTQGTGGVSCFAIQLAAAAGATVIATSSSDDKLDFAKKLGAKHTINYKTTPNWSDEVRRLTNGRGVDHVIEVGGSSTIEQSLKSVRNGGLVTALGVLTFGERTDLIPLIVPGAKTVRGVIGAGSKEMNSRFVEFIEEHDIRPVIASTFLFDEAPQALASLEKQREIGKIVIKIEK